MRIEFPRSPREDFHWTQPQLRIGSAADNDLVLAASHAADHHVRIQQGPRGWVLHVLDAAARIHVNARPVRERALLRPGDVVSVGGCRMLLRDDQDPALRPTLRVPAERRCTVALRAVGGPLSGRVMPLRDSLELGSQSRVPLDLPRGEQASLRIFWLAGELMLEANGTSAGYPLRVNGVVSGRLALQPGDQIGLAAHRFVIDGPGMMAETVVETVPTQGAPECAAGPRGEVWWLIITAAVLALGIAMVLLIRF